MATEELEEFLIKTSEEIDDETANFDLKVDAGEMINLQERAREAMLQMNVEAQEAAWRDALTGLNYRRSLDHTLEHIFADPPAKTMTALFIDIDHFKKVNDTYGHPMGDKVISDVAKTIFNGIRGKRTQSSLPNVCAQ